ncbi:MAG: hypothetical protein JXK07_02305 [Spirochaetes bacterium]|nr:hypothetical protein [Spirochaetota bacterium]MBN2771886.1 hypothetical protein [Spirochaetota bacterium]
MISQKEMIIDFIKSKDFIAKIVCLILAVILWSYIGTQGNSDVTLRIKTEYKNLSSEYVVSDIQKTHVNVKISGREDELDAFNKNDIRVFVDFKNAVPDNRYRYDVELVSSPDIPRGIDIKLMDKSIFATVEKKVSKTVFIEPVIAGQVRSGYFAGNVRAQPDRVVVYGSPEQVQKIDSIKTMPLSVAHASDNVSDEVLLDTDGYSFTEISSDKTLVTAEVFSAQNVVKYEREIDLFGKMDNYLYEIHPDKKITVYIISKDGSVPQLDINDVRVWTDLSNIDSSKFITSDGNIISSLRVTSRVRAVINNRTDSVQIINIVPDVVTIRIKNDN